MVFNSAQFLLFFGVFIHLYWLINIKASARWSNIFLILASYLFYGWWDWRFLSLIFISSLADYILGLRITTANNQSLKKTFLTISICINLGILGFFKYFNFFIDSAEVALHQLGIMIEVKSLNIILPVGISFYTFQTMSYTIDIYRDQLKATKRWEQFFAYVAFFPQLVAGPIERAARFLPQFSSTKKFNQTQVTNGLRLMLWGFFKKIVIADNLALLADEIFAQPNEFATLGILLGTILFAFQIYCDFSGYSDIAIGLGKTLGFELMTNFRTPYFSSSFSEFWQRWHISLSTWFRDYVYIPLGGNRVSKTRNRINLLITFVVSGLWHGANITFIIWGFMHGLLLVAEKKIKSIKIPTLLIFLVVSILWIPFRATSYSHFTTLCSRLFHIKGANDWNSLLILIPDSKLIVFAVMFALFLTFERFMNRQNFSEVIALMKRPQRLFIYLALIFSILLMGNFDVKPNFIYFQF